MKKLISVLLCLMLLCTATCAVAERMYPIENAQILNSVSGLLSCEVPADYMIMTDELVIEVIEAATAALEDENNELGVDPAVAQRLIDIFSNVDPSISDYVYDMDFTGNMNIQAVANSGLSQSMLETQYESLAESLTQQYLTMGAVEEDCKCIGLVSAGNNPTVWFQYDVTLFGAPISQFMTCSEAGDFVTLTFSNMPLETVQAVLESFAWAE